MSSESRDYFTISQKICRDYFTISQKNLSLWRSSLCQSLCIALNETPMEATQASHVVNGMAPTAHTSLEVADNSFGIYSGLFENSYNTNMLVYAK